MTNLCHLVTMMSMMSFWNVATIIATDIQIRPSPFHSPTAIRLFGSIRASINYDSVEQKPDLFA